MRLFVVTRTEHTDDPWVVEVDAGGTFAAVADGVFERSGVAFDRFRHDGETYRRSDTLRWAGVRNGDTVTVLRSTDAFDDLFLTAARESELARIASLTAGGAAASRSRHEGAVARAITARDLAEAKAAAAAAASDRASELNAFRKFVEGIRPKGPLPRRPDPEDAPTEPLEPGEVWRPVPPPEPPAPAKVWRQLSPPEAVATGPGVRGGRAAETPRDGHRSRVFVASLTGKKYELMVDLRGTGGQIKVELESREGFPVREQRLIFAGAQLHDTRALCDYGVRADSTVTLHLRLCGD